MSVPANLLQLQNATKSFGSRVLFEGANCSINEGEHIGVIGPNGAGKTTFFKVLADELELDKGDVIRSRKLSLGYLRQHDSWDESQTLEEYLMNGTKTPIWDLRKLGLDLGLQNELFDLPLKALSGGYKMRAKLLHLLGQEPNVMMLDEPTNYLDLETLLVLEKFLQNYNGAFLLISHDREFLRRTTDHILEIEGGDFVKFSGNIDDYFEQKQMLRGQLEKQALSDAARRKEILDFAARFGAKASKARQAQSRLKRLDKMEAIELKPLPIAAKIRIPNPIPTGRIAIEIKDTDFGYPEKTILHRVNLRIESKERLGIVGFNGAGKSTLLKSIARELAPVHGDVEYGYQVSAGYYAQHVPESLNPQDTVTESLGKTAHPEVKSQEILDLAGSLLFSGDQMKKKISVLSGGEKARVALGRILLKKSPLLLLDEPTNHLDFYTVESLTQALETYPGTVVIVSHDRGFVRRVATKILEVKAGRLHLYHGTYDDYVWSVQQKKEGNISDDDSPPIIPREQKKEQEVVKEILKPKVAVSPYQKEKIKELEAAKRACDKSIQEIDRKLKAIESRMAEQSNTLSQVQGDEAARLAREMSAAQKKIQELEAELLAVMEKKESLNAEIAEIKNS